MSSSEMPGMRVRRNTQALESMPTLAYQQAYDALHDRTNTREKIVRVHQQQAQQQGRTNAALPPDAWEAMDTAVYQAAEDTLRLVDDLRAAGLTYTGVTLDAKYDTWGIIDDSGRARIGMTPEANTEESDFYAEEDGSPIPIMDDGYSVGFRENPVSTDRLPDDSIDTTKTSVATRHVSELVEQTFINAENIQITGETGEGYTLYGMTDHPQTATGNTSSDWTVDGNEVDIRKDIRNARYVLKNDRNYRPGNTGYWVYLGSEYYDELDDADPEGDGNQTVRDRVENLANISRIAELDFLDNKSMLMFRPTEDVIQVGMPMDMSTVQWEDPFRDHWRVLASMYPRIKRTFATPDAGGTYMNGILYWTSP